MYQQRRRGVVTAIGLIGLAGCAALDSQVLDDTKPTPDGIIYYLPRRPFIATVTTSAAPSPVTTVSVAQGVAEPDLSHRFALSQGTNLLAKGEMNISVGANGLLKTSNTTVTSEVATALQNAASAAGTFAGLAAVPPVPAPAPIAPPPPPNGCPPPGTNYQYLIYPSPRPGDPDKMAFCGYTVGIQLAAGAPTKTYNNKTSEPGSSAGSGSSSNSGIFYRHELPYLVTVTGPKDANGNAIVAASVLNSPNESEIDYFPVRRSFFANNTANITVTDGVVTTVDQTTEGELTAALSVPATVLNSYTMAIGSIFGSLTTNSADMQKLLTQQQATAAAQAQATVCRVTIANNPLTGLTGDSLTKALSAITAACG